MPGLSSYIKRFRFRYPRLLRILMGNPNQSSGAIPFFQPSYMPYQGSSLKLSPSTFGQQVSNQPVKEDVRSREQIIERMAGGIGDAFAGQATQLLPRMPQYSMLPSPECNIGAQFLLPKMPQYQRLPPPDSRNRNQIQKHKGDNIFFSLETSCQQVSARPVQKGVPLKNKKKIERKRNNISVPVLTTEAVRNLLPTTPRDQKLPSLDTKEHDKAVAVCKEMNVIRAFCIEYPLDNIYNMDETVILFRHVLYGGLVPESAKDGSQLTLALCVNATGSDRLPVGVITSEKKPSSIDGLDPKAFGAAWQFSDKSTMTAEAMREWLHLFYPHIGKQRKVILLLDNLIGHKKGIELAPPPSNIRIQWLPPGTTKRYQPLDQGINNALKRHYQQMWIKHMFGKLYGGELMNPIHAMSSELAVRWIIQIWEHHITSETIHDCFCKSSVLQPQPQPPGPASKNVPN